MAPAPKKKLIIRIDMSPKEDMRKDEKKQDE